MEHSGREYQKGYPPPEKLPPLLHALVTKLERKSSAHRRKRKQALARYGPARENRRPIPRRTGRREAVGGQAIMTLRTVAKNRSTRSTLRNWGDLIGDRPIMAVNPDEPCPRSFTEWVASEPLALMFGIVAMPMLAIAFGVCIAILAKLSGRDIKSQHKAGRLSTKAAGSGRGHRAPDHRKKGPRLWAATLGLLTRLCGRLRRRASRLLATILCA